MHGGDPGEACARWGFRRARLSRTLLGTPPWERRVLQTRASWERGRLARIDRRRSCRPICGRDARVPRTPFPGKWPRGMKSAEMPLEPTPNRGTTPSPWGKKFLDPRSLLPVSIACEQRTELPGSQGRFTRRNRFARVNPVRSNQSGERPENGASHGCAHPGNAGVSPANGTRRPPRIDAGETPAFPGRSTGINAPPRAGQREKALRSGGEPMHKAPV